MKTRTLLLSFVLFFVLGASAQTANYNADGTYKGTPVTSIDADFTTLANGSSPYSTSIQEALNIGFVKFHTVSQPYPYQGITNSVTLYTNGTTNGQQSNTISPAYIYLPTMSQGVGAITVTGANNGASNQGFALEYTDDNGVTWKSKATPNNVMLFTPAGCTTTRNLQLSGTIQLRIKLVFDPNLMIKSIKVSKYGETVNYNANGTYIGTPVTSFNVDFSTLIGRDVYFSNGIQECLNVGVVKFHVPDASAYPTTGSPVSYYLYTNGGSSGIDVNSVASPAYIYLPTMSQGVGAIAIDGAVNNQALTIEYTNNNGVTWNILTAPANYIKFTSSGRIATRNCQLSGSIQLRLKLESNAYIKVKSIKVSKYGETINYSSNGTYTGTPVTSIDVDFSTMPASEAAWSANIQESSNIGFTKFQTSYQWFPAATGPSLYTLYSNGTTNGQQSNTITPGYVYLPTMSSGVDTVTINTSLNNGGTQNLFVEYSDDNGVSWKSSLVSPNNYFTLNTNNSQTIKYYLHVDGSIQVRFKIVTDFFMMIKTIKACSWIFNPIIDPVTSELSPNDNPFYLTGNTLMLGSEKATVYFYNMLGQKIFEAKNATSSVVLPSTVGVVKVIVGSKVVTLKKI